MKWCTEAEIERTGVLLWHRLGRRPSLEEMLIGEVIPTLPLTNSGTRQLTMSYLLPHHVVIGVRVSVYVYQ